MIYLNKKEVFVVLQSRKDLVIVSLVEDFLTFEEQLIYEQTQNQQLYEYKNQNLDKNCRESSCQTWITGTSFSLKLKNSPEHQISCSGSPGRISNHLRLCGLTITHTATNKKTVVFRLFFSSRSPNERAASSCGAPEHSDE